MAEVTPPPSIAEQVEVIEAQIQSLRDSNADPAGHIADERALREMECMAATVALLRRILLK